MVILQIIITCILIAVYLGMAIIWIIKDPDPIKNRFNWLEKPLNLMHQILSIGTILLALVLYFKNFFVFPELFLPFTVTGLILFIGGSAFATWARIYMEKFWAPAHGGHNQEKQTRLHTGGPFKYSRNPIYTGLLFSRIGFFLTLNSWLMIVIPFYFWYFNHSIIKEEFLLKKIFGEIYQEYSNKVHRYL